MTRGNFLLITDTANWMSIERCVAAKSMQKKLKKELGFPADNKSPAG